MTIGILDFDSNEFSHGDSSNLCLSFGMCTIARQLSVCACVCVCVCVRVHAHVCLSAKLGKSVR